MTTTIAGGRAARRQTMRRIRPRRSPAVPLLLAVGAGAAAVLWLWWNNTPSIADTTAGSSTRGPHHRAARRLSDGPGGAADGPGARAGAAGGLGPGGALARDERPLHLCLVSRTSS